MDNETKSEYWAEPKVLGLFLSSSHVDMKDLLRPVKKLTKFVPINAKPAFIQEDIFKLDINEFTDKNDKLGLFFSDKEPYTYLTTEEPTTRTTNSIEEKSLP